MLMLQKFGETASYWALESLMELQLGYQLVVEPAHLKNIYSQTGPCPKVGVNIKKSFKPPPGETVKIH